MSPSSSEALALPAAGGWQAQARALLARGRNLLRTALKPDAVFVDAGAGQTDAAQRAQSAVASFAQWCAAHPGSRCEIGLSARLMHACVAPAEAGEMPAADLRDYAQRQFDFYFGGAEGDGYAVAVSTDARAPVACGASRRLVADLMATAAAHGVQVLRLAPWWARGLKAALAGLQMDMPESAMSLVERNATAGEAPVAMAALEPHQATLVLAAGPRILRLWAEPLHGVPDAAVHARWRERLGPGAPLWLLSLPEEDGEARDAVLRGKPAASALQRAA